MPIPQAALDTLTFDTTVARRLVHRAAICEVFLTGSTRLGEREFAVAAQLPRVHSYYSDQRALPRTYDPLLLIEVVRQAGIFVAHEHLGAPTSDKFLFESGDFQVADPEALRLGPGPGHVVARVELIDELLRDDVRVGATYRFTIAIEGRIAFIATAATRWMPGKAWDRLRERGRAGIDPATPWPAAPTVRPEAVDVGRAIAENVVVGDVELTGDTLASQLVVDQAHPALFDHALDHIPGMLLFEGVRQTALVTARAVLGLEPSRLSVSRIRADFTRFGEFELPAVVEADLTRLQTGGREQPTTVELVVRQGEHAIATATVELSVLAPPTAQRAARREPVADAV